MSNAIVGFADTHLQAMAILAVSWSRLARARERGLLVVLDQETGDELPEVIELGRNPRRSEPGQTS